MAKKYELPEEKPVMASEPLVAYNRQSNEYHGHMSVVIAENDDDIDINDIVFEDNRFYIPDEELRRLGRECINAPGISGEEAIRHFMGM